MKILNNLRCKRYVITAIIAIAFSAMVLFMMVPLGTGSECFEDTVEPVTLTTTINITTTSTTRVTTTQTTSVTTTSLVSSTEITTTSMENVTTEGTTTISVVNEPVQVVESRSDEQNDIIEEESNNNSEPVTYTVYKPSTHYIHKNTCRWFDSSCYEILNTDGLECLYCTECKPDMEILKVFEVPTSVHTSGSVSDYDRQLLAEIVYHEAGSNWISQYNKAKVAAGVMNRVNDTRFPSTVYTVLTAPGQFTGYWPGCCTPSQSCYDAVDYYFSHMNEFNGDNSWWGDGYQNHFYMI